MAASLDAFRRTAAYTQKGYHSAAPPLFRGSKWHGSAGETAIDCR
jgi:hypothetical protein